MAMKTIGRTNENNYLVEMNPDEHGALARLAKIEEGWLSMEAYFAHDSISFIDLSTPIGAIRHYTKSRVRLAELQSLLDDVKDLLTDDTNEKKE